MQLKLAVQKLANSKSEKTQTFQHHTLKKIWSKEVMGVAPQIQTRKIPKLKTFSSLNFQHHDYHYLNCFHYNVDLNKSLLKTFLSNSCFTGINTAGTINECPGILQVKKSIFVFCISLDNFKKKMRKTINRF